MSSNKEKITCDKHGEAPMAFVCSHIFNARDDQAVGFYQSYIDLLKEPYEYNAWCRDCEDRLVKAGYEWNDILVKHAGIKEVCLWCFNDFKDKQIRLNSADMVLSYVPEDAKVDRFYKDADRFIVLANKYVKEPMDGVCEALSFAASRFAAFEATSAAKDAAKNKQEIIDYYTSRFEEMFIDNLSDYIENKKTYLTHDE